MYPSPALLLALPCTLAFFQSPNAGLSALQRTGNACTASTRGATTWPAERSDGSAAAAVGRRRRARRPHAVPVLFGKGRKKRGAAVSQDASSWYDEDEEDAVVGGAAAGDSDGADAAAAAAFSTTPAAAATAEAGASSGDIQEGRRDVGTRGDKGSSSATMTDDILLPSLDDDGNQIVLEPVWVEGETQGEKPIVEAYGLNDALAGAEDGIDIDNGMMAGGVSGDEALLIPTADGGVLPGGLGDGVGPESWRNGMEVPDDDVVLGERFNMGRGLDDMLMERSVRFYDPKVTGERERCYLVGLEASGWGMGNKRDTKGSFPEKGAAAGNGDGEGGEDDGWTEEQEAAFQEEKQLAYEARKEEREMRFTLEESMAELSELAGTAGLEVAGSTYQRVLEPNPRTYIGTGKVKEIKSAMNQLGVCTVIFDDELSPGQQRSLEVEFGGEAAGIKVLDRTALILDIFAQHAKTREGQLQVDLALHMYRLPRLTKMWTHLERQQGGVGLRGPGERQLEVDRRLLKDKIIALKKELSGVRRHRDFQRRGRKKLGLPVVALVGYTNAGKSTLLNTLTRAGVMAENMLFATLDPTTRKVKLSGLKVHPEVMLTDTVGFIQKLPTNLVAAFRATLEEVVEADVIVHIVDVSSPSREKQESAVTGVLGEMKTSDKPRLTMWNKLDLLPEEEQEQVRVDAEERDELTVAASAMTGEGLDDFVTCLEEAICALLFKVEAVVPYSRGDLLSRVHELGACDTEEYTDAGTLIQARVPAELLNRLEPFFTPEFKETSRVEASNSGAEEAAALREENTWKQIAKKRLKTSSLDEEAPVAVPK
ncbi:PHflX, plastid HflX GTPase [Ectocarpus siliculosus]|uniref:PHflX, plastid HflX GTPase n=1 Tax=Ectocarpus siliculosus TaxID=2880 RepID=D7G4N1_ECTSI|nr:PHflX, plastid HflX GTPase [Ectocarpus siliculosus]|eukprot:CBJ33718.1 PHflX, plastid HflX GTPase [Ectocarpus siliculosus]